MDLPNGVKHESRPSAAGDSCMTSDQYQSAPEGLETVRLECCLRVGVFECV